MGSRNMNHWLILETQHLDEMADFYTHKLLFDLTTPRRRQTEEFNSRRRELVDAGRVPNDS